MIHCPDKSHPWLVVVATFATKNDVFQSSIIELDHPQDK